MVLLKSCVFLLLLIMVQVVENMDLSPGQIQFVADHLTDEKCDRLLFGLRLKSFTMKPFYPFIPRHSDTPCLDRLTYWLNGPGHNLTFDFLCWRLKEIGLPKVANRLSREVLGDTAVELHKTFLDDPFQELIPTESIMFDKQDKTTKIIPLAKAEDGYETMFIVVLVLGAFALTCFIPLAVCLVCPRALHLVCLRACPTCCSIMMDCLIDGCHRIWYGSKKATEKYLFVTPKHGGGALMV